MAKQKSKPAGYWNKKARVLAAAKKCESRSHFQRDYGSAYNAAKRNGWQDEVYAILPSRKCKEIRDGKKQCTECDQWKSIDKFEKHKSSHMGRMGRCKVCSSKRVLNSRGASIDTFLQHIHRRHRNNLAQGSARRSAMIDEVTLELLQQLWHQQDGRCAISGEAMTHITGDGRTQTNASIDRIDSSREYETNNVQLVCSIVNLMKHHMDLRELLIWCHRIRNRPGRNQQLQRRNP